MTEETNLPVDELWLEGFCKAAADAGMDEQAAAHLLRDFIHQAEMETNEKYAEAYTGEMEKVGQGFLARWLPRMKRMGMFGLGAAGAIAGDKMLDTFNASMLTPQQQARLGSVKQMEDLVRGGAEPSTVDLYAGQMGRSGMKDLQSQLKAYQSIYPSGNDRKDYYRQWYLD